MRKQDQQRDAAMHLAGALPGIVSALDEAGADYVKVLRRVHADLSLDMTVPDSRRLIHFEFVRMLERIEELSQ